MIDALIFDFDGLIIDTETPEYLTWQEIYQSHGVDLPLSVWENCIGASAEVFDPYGYLEELVGRKVDRDAIRKQRRKRYYPMVESQPILPGVQEYISEAKQIGVKLAVASSSSRDWVVSNLSRLALLDSFDCIKSSDDVPNVKPDPALYLVAVADLNAAPNRSIAIEDSLNGVLAAKRAGLFCIAVPNNMTKQLSLDCADIRLDSLSDLPLKSLLSTVYL